MNKVLLLGRLTKDVEIKKTKSNKSVAQLSIAINSGKDEVNYFNIIAWDKLAENASKYIKKGSQILVDARLSNDKYTDKDGKTVYRNLITANNIEFIGTSNKETKEDTNDNPF